MLLGGRFSNLQCELVEFVGTFTKLVVVEVTIFQSSIWLTKTGELVSKKLEFSNP